MGGSQDACRSGTLRIHVHAVEAQAHPFVAGRVELKLVTVPRRPTDRVPDGASNVSSVRRVKGEGWLPVRAGGHCHHSILTHASQYTTVARSLRSIYVGHSLRAALTHPAITWEAQDKQLHAGHRDPARKGHWLSSMSYHA